MWKQKQAALVEQRAGRVTVMLASGSFSITIFWVFPGTTVGNGGVTHAVDRSKSCSGDHDGQRARESTS